MLLKVCISETGDVPRVLVLESSGNPDVDKYYTAELMKWTFTPVERANKKVPSVIPVAVTLYVK
jgi:outer membrane biosynthesis protein TonB